MKIYFQNIFPVILMVLSTCHLVYAQNVIELRNSSFEGMPGRAKVPAQWKACQVDGETPPDTHPDKIYNVITKAKDGKSYIGLLARENFTWESVYQKLSAPLMPNQCYALSFYLCMSDSYMVGSGNNLYPYTHPLVFKIWGGNAECSRSQLLARSTLIDHTDWRKYTFKLSPNESYDYILIEASYETISSVTPPNGNILVDGASQISPVSCSFIPPLPESSPEPIVKWLEPLNKQYEDDQLMLYANAVIRNLSEKQIEVIVNDEICSNVQFDFKRDRLQANFIAEKGMNVIKIIGKNEYGSSEDINYFHTGFNRDVNDNASSIEVPSNSLSSKPIDISKLKYFKDFDLSDAMVGKKLEIKGLHFESDSSRILKENYDRLNELSSILKAYPDVKVEISGHTNGRIGLTRSLSLSSKRAKAVCNYLIKQGVASEQLVAKGYGKKYPIYSTDIPREDIKNQRVEIKVLEID